MVKNRIFGPKVLCKSSLNPINVKSSCRKFNCLSFDTTHMLKEGSHECSKADVCYTYIKYRPMRNVENAVFTNT